MMDLNALRRIMVEADWKYKNNHLASALSALPIIASIYENFDFNKDVFILSKGHACLALFAVLKALGKNPDFSQIHPDIDRENGVYCTTGSLGHGLPVGVGAAMAKKLKGEAGTVHVLMGDGECQEGTTWESLNIAARFDLSNLKVHIDRNDYQATDKILYDNFCLLEDLFHGVRSHYTKKGEGLKLFENHPDLHVHELTKEEYETSIRELDS